MGRSRRKAGLIEKVDSGTAELVSSRPGEWTLLVDGTPQSAVDLDDPTVLEFEYMRRFASVVDALAPPGHPVRVLHLGGGALTLPRYVVATRPGSVQHVVEADAALIALVRRELPLPRRAAVRVRTADARDAVEAAGAGRYDLVVTDVFAGGRVPARFLSVEFLSQVARVLRPAGLYAVNLADGSSPQAARRPSQNPQSAEPLMFSRGQAATARAVFADACLLAEPGVLRGRRYGNVVIVAGQRGVPVGPLAVSAARDPFPTRLLHGEEWDRFVVGAAPVTDATSTDSPPPPPGLFT